MPSLVSLLMLLPILTATDVAPKVSLRIKEGVDLCEICICREAELDCSGLGMTGIPQNGTYKHSQRGFSYDFSKNRLSRLSSDDTASFIDENVEKLNISYNVIEEINRNLFERLSSDVDVSHNKLSKINASLFSYNWELRDVRLNDNPIEIVDPNLFSTNRLLHRLDVSNTKITSMIFLWPVTTKQKMILNLSGLDRLLPIEKNMISMLYRMKTIVTDKRTKLNCKCEKINHNIDCTRFLANRVFWFEMMDSCGGLRWVSGGRYPVGDRWVWARK
jgi:hypothetical protein